MELKAIGQALERIPSGSEVYIYCDNDYVRLGIDVLMKKSDTEIMFWHVASRIKGRIRRMVFDRNKDLWDTVEAAINRGVKIQYRTVSFGGDSRHRRCHNLANTTRKRAEKAMGR